MELTISDLRKAIGKFEFKGLLKRINNVNTISDATENSAIWIKTNHSDFDEIVESTKACLIICHRSKTIKNHLLQKKGFILCEDPRLAFIRLVNAFFLTKPIWAIHPSSIISPCAKLSKQCFIGPNTYIGNATIAKGVIIYGNVYIYDNVKIGSNSIIHAGSIIGSDGFGYSRNPDGKFEKFPHLGGVIIQKDVEIGANVCIDRGTLGNTIIKTGAKIDNLVHIAHNVTIGKHTAVIANAMIGGSTVVNDYSWVAPSASLLNGLNIGNKVTIGMSAVVTKDIPSNEVWAGVPARPIKEFFQIQKHLKTFINEQY